jgi:predicted N-acyltransferase
MENVHPIIWLRHALVALTVLLSSAVALAQTDATTVKSTEPRNAVMLEGLGHGGFYSLNYERTLFRNSWTQTMAQVGFAYYSKEMGVIPLWVPITLNQAFRLHKNHYVELGAGKMLNDDGWEYPDGTFVNDYQFDDWVFRFGYRYHFRKEKWLLRVSYTPIYQDKSDYIHWGGIAFGYRF